MVPRRGVPWYRSDVDLTVVICTHRRPRLLAGALASLAGARRPRRLDWEVLVVDNASGDETPAVCAAAAGMLPLRYTREPTVGLSRARNRGLAEAGADLVVFIDDDVLVDGAFLEAYASAARERPAAAYFGGCILPEFEAPVPAWAAARRFDYVFSLLRLDAGERGAVEHGVTPFGANFAVRRSAAGPAPFDPSFGRSGRGMLCAEEMLLVLRLQRTGAEGFWVPQARVRHRVPARRMTAGYFASYHFGQARTEALLAEPRFYPSLLRLPAPLHRPALLAKAFLFAVRSIRQRRAGRDAWIDSLIEAARALGFAVQRSWGARRGCLS